MLDTAGRVIEHVDLVQHDEGAISTSSAAAGSDRRCWWENSGITAETMMIWSMLAAMGLTVVKSGRVSTEWRGCPPR